MAKQTTPLDPDTWNFPPETLAFLKDLKVNNNRDWFARNKSDFEQTVKRPAQEFCSLMIDELARLTGQAHESKIFRVYRDVRFSKDKTPYNAHLHISFIPSPRRGPALAWFFGLEPGKFSLGAGVFGFEKQVLDTYRERVAGPGGEELAGLLNQLTADGGRVSEPELKRVPPGYDKDHKFSELLRRKSLSVWLDRDDPNMVSKPGIAVSSGASFGRLKPIVDWLQLLST